MLHLMSEENIMKTADKLVKKGIISPTNAQIREEFGFGSMSTISPVMKKWREQRRSSLINNLEIPRELKNQSDENIAKIWIHAKDLAISAMGVMKSDYEQTCQELENELIEEKEKNNKLEEQNIYLLELSRQATHKEKEYEYQRNEIHRIKEENKLLRDEMMQKFEHIVKLLPTKEDEQI